jgi:hypothetical protein
LHGSIFVGTSDNQSWYHYQAMVRQSAVEPAALSASPTNSDYTAALRVLAEWKHPSNLDNNMSFPAFCKHRLNSAKAPNCV